MSYQNKVEDTEIALAQSAGIVEYTDYFSAEV